MKEPKPMSLRVPDIMMIEATITEEELPYLEQFRTVVNLLSEVYNNKFNSPHVENFSPEERNEVLPLLADIQTLTEDIPIDRMQKVLNKYTEQARQRINSSTTGTPPN